VSDHSTDLPAGSSPTDATTPLATGAGSGASGACGAASMRSNGAASVPDASTMTGFAPIVAAWFSVMPVIANNSMAVNDTAALIQCQL